MAAYIIRRILFMVPTLLGILLVSFVVVQFAPGGPIESVIARLSGADTGASSRTGGSPGGDFGARGSQAGSQLEAASSKYRGAQGLDPKFIASLEKQIKAEKLSATATVSSVVATGLRMNGSAMLVIGAAGRADRTRGRRPAWCRA